MQNYADLIMEAHTYAIHNPPETENQKLSLLVTSEGIQLHPILKPLPLHTKKNFVWIEYQAAVEWQWTPETGKVEKLFWRVRQTLVRTFTRILEKK